MKLPRFLKLLFSIPAFIGALLLSACAGSRTDKYKITVNVEVGGKVYSGSTVQYQKTYNGADWAAAIGGGGGVTRKGEAVVVNVDGKYLFLLWNYTIYGTEGDPNQKNWFSPWSVQNVWWKWNRGYRYHFVTFTDISNPMTVKQITPENLSQFFGDDAKITSIKIQRTMGPVTYGKVEQVIPWIRDGMRGKSGERKQPLFDADTKNYDINTYYSKLSVADFIQD